MNEETRKEIGSALGKVLDVDGKAIVAEQACFLRVRIDIPLDKPLQRGLQWSTQRGIDHGLHSGMKGSWGSATLVGD